MAKRITQILFIILLFSIPMGEIIRIPFLSKQINILEISATLLVTLSLITKQISFKNKLKKPILVFGLVLLVSLLVSLSSLEQTELIVSFAYLARWVLIALIYFVVSGFDKDFKNKIPKIMIASGFVFLVGGLVQYFLYPNLRNLYYLGWDEHLYRLFSSFLDPNFAGAFLVLLFLLIIGSIRSKIWLLTLGALTLIGIGLTYSRSAYLMLVVGILVYAFTKGKKKLALGIVGVFVLGIITLSIVGSKSEGTNLLRITSTQARLPSAQNAVAIFRDNPILGVGFDAYEFAIKKYNLGKPSKYINHASAGTDNSFLFVLATTGIVGFAAYVYLWSQILKPSKGKYWSILLSSSVALFVNSFFINSLFYSFIMVWVWVLIALEQD